MLKKSLMLSLANFILQKIAVNKKERHAFIGLIICVGIFILGSAFLSLLVNIKENNLKNINLAWNSIENEYQEINNLENFKTELLRELFFIESLKMQRDRWTVKLNNISQILPDNTWLTYLNVIENPKNKNYVIQIKGATTCVRTEEMSAEFGKFLQKLKLYNFFGEDIKEITFVSTWRDKIEDVDVIRFSLEGIN